MIRIAPLEDVHVARPTCSVEASGRSIEAQIVDPSSYRKRTDLLAGLGVEDNDRALHVSVAAANEQPVVSLVERDRDRLLPFGDRPGSDHGPLLAVDHPNLILVGDVHIQSWLPVREGHLLRYRSLDLDIRHILHGGG